MGMPMIQEPQQVIQVVETGANLAIWVPVIVAGITAIGGVVAAWLRLKANRRKKAQEAEAAKNK